MITEPGKYPARAISESVQFGRSRGGSEQIAVTFRILDGKGNPTSDEMTWIGSFANEKSLEITAKALRACGCAEPKQLMTNPASIASKVVELDVQNETFEGKTHLRIKWVNSPMRFSFKEKLDEGAKAMALARLEGYSAKVAAGASDAVADDDRIPF